MQKLTKDLIWIIIPLVMACSSSNNISQSEEKKWAPEYRVQLGTNHGGITENTDFSGDESIEPDAFSGATKLGVNAGAHVLLPIKRNYVETGIDYMLNSQTFKFADSENNYSGERKINTSQLLFPVTYNVGFVRKKYAEGLFQAKLGYVFQYNFFNVDDSGNSLPEYTTNNFSSGFTIGLATTPFRLKNGASLGLYLDGYRGSKIYDDFYNRSSFDMPGSSYFKIGLIYHFNTR